MNRKLTRLFSAQRQGDRAWAARRTSGFSCRPPAQTDRRRLFLSRLASPLGVPRPKWLKFLSEFVGSSLGSRGTLKLPKRAQAHFHSHVAMPCMKSEYWLKGSLWTEMPSTGYSHMSKPHKLMLLRSKHMYGCETHRRLIRNSFTCPKDSCRRCRSRPPLLLPSSSLRSQSADHVPASKFQSAKPDAMPKKPCAS